MATVSIREWLAKFRQQRDAAAMGQAKAMANETHEERAVASGDIAGVAADEQAARIAGQTPSEADRLGD
jgi:hypothetical protein